MTFGSMRGVPPAELSATVDRVLGAERRVIVQGSLADGDASPNLRRIDAVDHRALFPSAALVVHHGGAERRMPAAAGVPSVVVPQIGDQRYWADRLHRLGVAPPPVPLAGLSGEALAESILGAAADHGLREAADDLALRLRVEAGIGTAIRLLEATEDRAA